MQVCSMPAVAATKQSITAEVPLKGTFPTSVGISGPGYASAGPCTPSPVHRDSLTIPLGGYQTSTWGRVRTSIRSVLGWSTQTLGLGGGAKQVTIKLTVTLPSCGGGDGGTLKAPFPVIFFFNGFAVSFNPWMNARNLACNPCTIPEPAHAITAGVASSKLQHNNGISWGDIFIAVKPILDL